eukprot:4885250-Prorocentrum_lima.AAC.1
MVSPSASFGLGVASVVPPPSTTAAVKSRPTPRLQRIRLIQQGKNMWRRMQRTFPMRHTEGYFITKDESFPVHCELCREVLREGN